MTEAKDTVIDMHNPQIMPDIYYSQQNLLRRQAEISFKAGQESVREEWNDAMDLGLREAYKAGMKEVVEFCNKEINPQYISFDGKRYFTFMDKVWQAQLKEWGIEEVKEQVK